MSKLFHRIARRTGRAIAAATSAATLSHCACETPVIHHHAPPRLGPSSFVSADSESFGYRKWLPEGRKPDTVVIGIHGFCGAAIDYENLANHLLETYPAKALYAYELRGQGNDPVRRRRGDIRNPAEWFEDLDTFTRLLRAEHPGARIVWFGESMGALIAAHACHQAIQQSGRPPCDALVLASPVVTLSANLPEWKKTLVRVLARGFPRARLSLETLTGGEPVRMTADTLHAEQVETNPWHVERHTLRLLVALGKLIERMPLLAPVLEVPTLVLHGGRDFASKPADVAGFFAQLPAEPANLRRFYPQSHHLLMYDFEREQVVRDAARWIEALDGGK